MDDAFMELTLFTREPFSLITDLGWYMVYQAEIRHHLFISKIFQRSYLLHHLSIKKIFLEDFFTHHLIIFLQRALCSLSRAGCSWVKKFWLFRNTNLLLLHFRTCFYLLFNYPPAECLNAFIKSFKASKFCFLPNISDEGTHNPHGEILVLIDIAQT